MGETLKCIDCIHYYLHPGCIHSQGTGDANTCDHFEDSDGIDDWLCMFPECQPSDDEGAPH